MSKEVNFSAQISKRNRVGLVVGVPKKTVDANPELKHGAKVNVALKITASEDQ